MGCTYDIFSITVQKEDFARKFSETWIKFFTETKNLYYFDYDAEELFKDFDEVDGEFVLNIEAEPMFKFDNNGKDIRQVIMVFVENYPDAEFYAEYTCDYENCSDALYDAYHYQNGKLKIRHAYSECGVGDFCPECNEVFCINLIEIDPEIYADGYICPDCGEKLFYEADVNEYVLEIVDGKWKYPENFRI